MKWPWKLNLYGFQHKAKQATPKLPDIVGEKVGYIIPTKIP
jgi:hypothetical protein